MRMNGQSIGAMDRITGNRYTQIEAADRKEPKKTFEH